MTDISDIFNFSSTPTTSHPPKRQRTETLAELNDRLQDRHTAGAGGGGYVYRSNQHQQQQQQERAPRTHNGPIPSHLDPILRHIRKHHLPTTSQPVHSTDKLIDRTSDVRRPSDVGADIDNTIFAADGFTQFHLHPTLVTTVQNKLHYVQPTQIQSLSIPLLLDDKTRSRDVLIKSDTGSGKTLAYTLPVIHRLLTDYPTIDRTSGIHTLILAPTRELVLQIQELIMVLLQNVLYKCVVTNVMGGEAIKREKARLRKGCNILVGTPGRLVYHLQNTTTLKFDRCVYLVLDECDRLLDLGFENDIKTIVEHLNSCAVTPDQRQSILVSATLSSAVLNVTHLLLRNPIKVGFDVASSKSEPAVAAVKASPAVLANDAVKQKDTVSNDGSDDFEVVAAEPEVESDGDVEIKAEQNGDSELDHDDTIDHNAIADQVLSAQADNAKLREYTLPSTLKHYYVNVDARHRLVALCSYIRQHIIDHHKMQKPIKLIVFISTCASVDFHYMLFKHCYWPDDDAQLPAQQDGDNSDDEVDDNTVLPPLLNIPVYKLHGNLSQKERTDVYTKFSQSLSGLLLCTDVAARGLDLPAVDMIVQYDAPELTEDYIHRSGRTARMGRAGNTCLFLLPHETPYLDVLRRCNIQPMELNVGRILMSLKMSNHGRPRVLHDGMTSSGAALQRLAEGMVNSSTELKDVAVQAYTSWLRAYAGYPKAVKHIFVTKKLHLGHIARCFALQATPNEIMQHSKRMQGEANKDGAAAVKRVYNKRAQEDRSTDNKAVAVAVKAKEKGQQANSRRNPANKPNAMLSATGATRQAKALNASVFTKTANTFNEFAS